MNELVHFGAMTATAVLGADDGCNGVVVVSICIGIGLFGFRIAGAYRVDGAVLRADLDIYDLASDASIARFAVEGSPEDPSGFASCVARSAQDWIRHHVHRGSDAPPTEVSVTACGG